MGEKKRKAEEKPFHPLYWTQRHKPLSSSREKTLVKSSGTERLLDNKDLSTAGLLDTRTVLKVNLGLYLTPLDADSPVLGPPA